MDFLSRENAVNLDDASISLLFPFLLIEPSELSMTLIYFTQHWVEEYRGVEDKNKRLDGILHERTYIRMYFSHKIEIGQPSIIYH